MINRHTAIGRRMLREMRRGRSRAQPPAEVRGPSVLQQAFESIARAVDVERRMRAHYDALAEIGQRSAPPAYRAEGANVEFSVDELLDDANADGFTELGRQLAEEWMEKVVLRILSEPVSPFFKSASAGPRSSRTAAAW